MYTEEFDRVSMLVALVVCGMPLGQTLLSGPEDAATELLGRMVSPRNLEKGPAAAGMAGQEATSCA